MHIYVKKGDQAIVMADDMASRARDLARQCEDELQEMIADSDFNGRISPGDYISEIERLIGIAEKAVAEETDIFNYLPLTKAGKLPKNKNILIADSRLADPAGYGYGGGYFPKRLQLRLFPCYASEIDFVYDRKTPGLQRLEIDLCPSAKKQDPVFGLDGNIRKIAPTEKASYLKDRDIIPGRIYAEKSGSEYLYLGELDLKIDEYRNNICIYKDNSPARHCYIRMSKPWRDKLSKCASIDDIIRLLAAYDPADSYAGIQKCSWREHPRKFVRETETFIENSIIKGGSLAIARGSGYDSFAWK